jgi:5-methylcytosine-specific restriction protein A
MEIIKGQEYKRKEIHNFFGGQRQGGVSTPRNHSIIFVFTNKRGKDFGYLDGWNDGGYFLYTGEGQKGDMTFQSGNKALRDHGTDGKQVFLFE